MTAACPFCGDVADVVFVPPQVAPTSPGLGPRDPQHVARVVCRGCGAYGPKAGPKTAHPAAVEAVALWNRRAE